MKRKPKDPTTNLPKTRFNRAYFLPVHDQLKKATANIFFLGYWLPQMCKKKEKYETIYVNFLFIKQKEGINVLQNGGGKKFQTIFKATAKILHHRLPHKVRQSGGFYIYFFFLASNRWFSDGFFSLPVAEVRCKKVAESCSKLLPHSP